MNRVCLGPRPGVRCGRLISGASRCPDCQRGMYQYRNVTRDQFARKLYGSVAWKRLSTAVVAAAECCAWCGTPKGRVKLTAGHIVSVARDRSLALDPSNVRASCASCQERAKREPDPSKWRGVPR